MPAQGLHEHAADSLAFIRATMARSATFTAVPGRGGIGMGLIGVAAAVAASQASDRQAWLAIWLGAALAAVVGGLLAMQIKARRHQMTLWSASGRRFAQGLVPSLAAGALLTAMLSVRAGEQGAAGSYEFLPAIWLLLYGAGVLAGATSSVPILTWFGAALMALGAMASLTPRFGDLWLAAGFGGLHIIFGIIIARKHGG
jgi:hypothetical protein